MTAVGGGTEPKAPGAAPKGCLFATASPPSARQHARQGHVSPGVATPVIDATTLTPWLETPSARRRALPRSWRRTG